MFFDFFHFKFSVQNKSNKKICLRITDPHIQTTLVYNVVAIIVNLVVDLSLVSTSSIRPLIQIKSNGISTDFTDINFLFLEFFEWKFSFFFYFWEIFFVEILKIYKNVINPDKKWLVSIQSNCLNVTKIGCSNTPNTDDPLDA